MSVKWTEEQKKVIELRSRNILVSAAAGSGKTAVLVERIIQRIMDEREPLDVDRLLVMTYTEAAAGEMKERIAAAIEKKLEETEGNLHLERQATLIHSAAITTIHSFCLSVIRDHFHVIGIDPGFRIAEEGELKLLKQDVLDEMLEEYYERADKGFLDFVDRFGTGRTDRKVGEIILTLYEYSRSYPQPDKWLDSCVEAYEIDDENIEEHPMTRRVKERVLRQLSDVKEILDFASRICMEPDGPYMYDEVLEADREEIDRAQMQKTFRELGEAVGMIQWKRLPSKKDPSVNPEKRDKVKKLRDKAKGMVKEIREAWFEEPVDEWVREMQETGADMVVLADLVRCFSAMFDEKKRSRNLIDFSDMEQFALAILTEEKDGELVPSPTANEYQERFEEVMIDEYQDSNLVQETLLTSVSRVSKGQWNIFMVGDVKQSIYRFRLSRPELFMEKYHTYSLEESERQRIDLHRNFRSRTEVLDSANYVFRKLMREEFGGIEYDENAALYPGASFPEVPEGSSDQTELLLLDKKMLSGEDSRKMEARMIAARIRELTESGYVLDKETGAYRKVRYKDIVILTRSLKGWAETFSAVLGEEGIPAYSVSREGYFETYEVSVLLDYLKILDNMRQELPLTAVLTSAFAGLGAKELAEIRTAYPELKFYEAVQHYAEEKQDGLAERLQAFLEKVEKFRERIPYTAIHDLLGQIVRETGYGYYIAAMPGGAQRMANIEMLSEKASAFESTSYKGLFNFVRYIEQLKKYEVDYGEAGIMDEQADTVRILSIHKSKGLEFPVVFVAGLGKKFNMQDTKSSIVLHSEWGVGMDAVDLVRRTKTPTFLKKVIQKEAALESQAEELRVLYVAMTRAKEKMILTGITELTDVMTVPQGRPDLYVLESARCYGDWLLPVTFPDENGNQDPECPIRIRIFSPGELETEGAIDETADQIALDVLSNWDSGNVYVPSLRRQLEEQMNYKYLYESEGKMKMKFTVSELKKRGSLEEESGEELIKEEIIPVVPEFLSEKEVEVQGTGGTVRGNAYHRFLEKLDFRASYDNRAIAEKASEFAGEGSMTEEMASLIKPGDMMKFLESTVGQRMKKAAEQNLLKREQPFVLGIPASQLYPEDVSGEKILIQGIIDVYFEEDGQIVLLDYKTDRIRREEELKERYWKQLEYYAQALEKLLSKKVKEKIIYSFALGKEIKL